MPRPFPFRENVPDDQSIQSCSKKSNRESSKVCIRAIDNRFIIPDVRACRCFVGQIQDCQPHRIDNSQNRHTCSIPPFCSFPYQSFLSKLSYPANQSGRVISFRWYPCWIPLCKPCTLSSSQYKAQTIDTDYLMRERYMSQYGSVFDSDGFAAGLVAHFHYRGRHPQSIDND